MDKDGIRDLMDRAKAKGMDPVDQLDRMGLLHTDVKAHMTTRAVAANLADMIELLSPSQLQGDDGRLPATGVDMKRAIVAFIRKHFTGEG